MVVGRGGGERREKDKGGTARTANAQGPKRCYS